MGYNLLINGVYWGYNRLTNLLLTFLGHPSMGPNTGRHFGASASRKSRKTVCTSTFHPKLVGGFDPSEKYTSKWESDNLPQVGLEIQKYLSRHHLEKIDLLKVVRNNEKIFAQMVEL